jgi:perosamine synthetase
LPDALAPSPTAVDRPLLPYGRHWIHEDDIQAVVEVLRGDWLTTGPLVERFEQAWAERVEAREAVAVSSGTAALHAAMAALEIGAGDEVIVPAMTFVATANAVVYQGAMPVFADVDPATLLLDPLDLARHITPRTRAVVAVDYAGQPCDYPALRAITAKHELRLVADAAHSLGASDHCRPAGSLADLTTFSLHPVKAITSGEGGVITTDDPACAARMRRFRNHGLNRDHHQRAAEESWQYGMVELGYNYRLTDFQCALGLSQLTRLETWIARRRAIAARYDAALAEIPGLRPLSARPEAEHAYHLYVVEVDSARLGLDRARLFAALRKRGIGVNVHYLPVHLHPYYRRRFGTGPGLCPIAEAAYQRVLSLPIFPAMTDHDVDFVVESIGEAAGIACG